MVTIRDARPSDADMLATLIMQAMSPACCAYFYGPQHTAADFHAFLSRLCGRRGTQYSYAHALVACDGGDGPVVGLALAYDGGQLHALRQAFIDGMLADFGRDFRDIPDETGAGELYLDSFAVLPAWQGQGIGTQLLRALARRARAEGFPCVGLLVDDANPDALRLYLRAGFRQAGTNSWGGHAMTHLVLPTTGDL